MTAPKISVLGDGISSFEGYVPRQASFYSPSYVSYSGFDSPEGTWWMQLTKLLGGEFLANNAYAGSHVSYAGHYSACLPRRIRSLATEDASPDIILVYAGINDVAHSIDLDKFQRDYREMLDSLKKFHPDAQIWVGTIVVGKECEPYYLDPVPLKNGENTMPSSISAWKRPATGSTWWICPPLTAFTKPSMAPTPTRRG